MNQSRRSFLQALAGAGVIASTASVTWPLAAGKKQPIDVSSAVLTHLASIPQHYREMQRGGLSIDSSMRDHAVLVQQALEETVNDQKRRELWNVLARCQLLIRLGITNQLARAKTWNDWAIASAQASNDPLLLSATIGHLAHLYLTAQQDPITARHLLAQAQEKAKGSLALVGWLTLLDAAMAAREGQRQPCKTALTKALDLAGEVKETDVFFTDFSVAGTGAFAANCLLKIGEPAQALQQLTVMRMQELADNRQASAFYDFSRAYAAIGESGEAAAYALRSIEKAVATDRLYILPRLASLAAAMRKKDPHNPHATTIVDTLQEFSQRGVTR